MIYVYFYNYSIVYIQWKYNSKHAFIISIDHLLYIIIADNVDYHLDQSKGKSIGAGQTAIFKLCSLPSRLAALHVSRPF